MAGRTSTTATAATYRPLRTGMRALLLVATVLVLLAGAVLTLAPTRTDTWFAWTIDVPQTATFLGAAYLASAVVEATSARARWWAEARVAVPSVFTFTTLTLLVTLLHLQKFHLGADQGALPRGITWMWLAIYVVVPVAMAVLWWHQQRAEGTDPPRTHPLPLWLRAAVGVVAAGLLGLGVALLLSPTEAAAWWPWPLTPLTGRAVGAWLVGLGVAGAQVVIERDALRARPVAYGGLALAALAGVGLARFPADVAWGTPRATGFVTALLVWAALSTAILAVGRRPGAAAPAG
jgi:hypothetical protein